MKTFLRRVIERKGYRLERITDADDLDAFFASVSPVALEQPLIRIGGPHDGGYLVPDDLQGIVACFSPGVADRASFEEQLAAMGIRSFLADRSVDAAPVTHDLISFEKKFLGDSNEEDVMRLEDWIGDHQGAVGGADLLLQMDIEGAEYRVLLDTSVEILRKFRILVVEFHEMDRLFDRGAFPFIRQAFDRVLEGFDVVHIHPNNLRAVVSYGSYEVPPLMEFTFLRKDRSRKSGTAVSLPHPHDSPNVPGFPDIALPGCWKG